MHHMFDETPNDPMVIPEPMAVTSHSDAIYSTHFGRITPGAADNDKAQVDTSQYRYRILYVCFMCASCMFRDVRKSLTLSVALGCVERANSLWCCLSC